MPFAPSANRVRFKDVLKPGRKQAGDCWLTSTISPRSFSASCRAFWSLNFLFAASLVSVLVCCLRARACHRAEIAVRTGCSWSSCGGYKCSTMAYLIVECNLLFIELLVFCIYLVAGGLNSCYLLHMSAGLCIIVQALVLYMLILGPEAVKGGS